jgi:hypothetical protein
MENGDCAGFLKGGNMFGMLYRIAATGLMLAFLFIGSGMAEEKKDMGGWERNSKYDKLYVPSDRDSFKGIVTGFKEITPFPGMSPGVALLVKDPDGDIVTVHLGPRWFIDPAATGIRKDDKVKVKGAWVEINNEDIVIASKISKGDFFEYKVRLTKDGTPFWTLSKEELERERAESQKR